MQNQPVTKTNRHGQPVATRDANSDVAGAAGRMAADGNLLGDGDTPAPDVRTTRQRQRETQQGKN